jgi:2-polyprenyl-3-methyl-5-hydroxy-6-metoxy-1,4-benzoquinol methylase
MQEIRGTANVMRKLLRPTILLIMAMYRKVSSFPFRFKLTRRLDFVMTILEMTSTKGSPTMPWDFTTLRLQSFARLWLHNDKAMFERIPEPMNELLSQCQGTILDVGPGTGVLLRRFNSEKISCVYGAEPSAKLHPALLSSAKHAGLGDKYHVLLCGGEPQSLIPALVESGALRISKTEGTWEEGIFDRICCLRVLCCVPNPEETMKSLYSLLKPGGKMIICEHAVNPWRTQGSIAARLMQMLYTLVGWSFFMGGCELQRHTYSCLQEAGDWESFNLQYIRPKDVIPFVVGELVKKL